MGLQIIDQVWKVSQSPKKGRGESQVSAEDPSGGRLGTSERWECGHKVRYPRPRGQGDVGVARAGGLWPTIAVLRAA